MILHVFEDGVNFSFYNILIPDKKMVYASTENVVVIGRESTLEEAKLNAKKLLVEDETFNSDYLEVSKKWRRMLKL